MTIDPLTARQRLDDAKRHYQALLDDAAKLHRSSNPNFESFINVVKRYHTVVLAPLQRVVDAHCTASANDNNRAAAEPKREARVQTIIA